MRELHPELVSAMPERCRDCKPLALIVRMLGNLIAEGTLSLEEAVRVVTGVADVECAGPKDNPCSTPGCRHGQGETYLANVGSTITHQGEEAVK